MKWLNGVLDEAERRNPGGEIIIESGISPSGSYHMGYLREIITCDAIVTALKQRGRMARHVHFVDDQDGFRKVPFGLPEEYSKYLGKPLFDMPAPEGSGNSYADYALKPFLQSVSALGIEMDVIRSHEKYASGFFVPAIELALVHIKEVKQILEQVSGRKLGEEWSPIQVNEQGYLKKRPFVAIDTSSKTIKYLDKDGHEQTTEYDRGQVKLDWRLDWPARWWLLKVDVEPFGRDHATKGGSYDTGRALTEQIFKSDAPIPVPYEFINRAGENKKMSASAGTGITISEAVQVLPPEVIRFFILRNAPSKTLFFDPLDGVVRLIDEYSEFVAKTDKTPDESQLLMLCTHDIQATVSSITFSHLVMSYQAARRDKNLALEVIKRTKDYNLKAENEKQTILRELDFIEQWLDRWAPEDVKFAIKVQIKSDDFSQKQRELLKNLSTKIVQAPSDAQGEWFHKAIYDLKDDSGLSNEQLFKTIYQALIGQDHGPRAGWFLSDLYTQDKQWLVKRLNLES